VLAKKVYSHSGKTFLPNAKSIWLACALLTPRRLGDNYLTHSRFGNRCGSGAMQSFVIQSKRPEFRMSCGWGTSVVTNLLK
jgi:hypothetical protein